MRLITLILVVVMAGCGDSRADSTFVPKRQICRIDTIYTDDPRCARMDTAYRYPNLPNRGLDSVYTLPHDTVVNCHSVPGPCPGYPQAIPDTTLGDWELGVSCAVLHWREVCDTIQIPGHWTYYRWVGKTRQIISTPKKKDE